MREAILTSLFLLGACLVAVCIWEFDRMPRAARRLVLWGLAASLSITPLYVLFDLTF